MKTTGFQRPAAAIFAGAALAATIAAFAIGQAARSRRSIPCRHRRRRRSIRQRPTRCRKRRMYRCRRRRQAARRSPRRRQHRVRRPSRRRHRSRRKRPTRPPRQSPLHRAGTPAIIAGFATAGAGATAASMPCACSAPPTIQVWANSIRPIRMSAISTACGPAITRDCGAPIAVRGESEVLRIRHCRA